MILKNKGVNDSTVLKLVSFLLKKNQSGKSYKVKTTEGTVTLKYEDIVGFVDELAKLLENGRYGVIHRCRTCGNFNPSGKGGKRGWCQPQNRSLFRNVTDHCSNWVPMTKEQRQIKEVLDGHFKSLQTK